MLPKRMVRLFDGLFFHGGGAALAVDRDRLKMRLSQILGVFGLALAAVPLAVGCARSRGLIQAANGCLPGTRLPPARSLPRRLQTRRFLSRRGRLL